MRRGTKRLHADHTDQASRDESLPISSVTAMQDVPSSSSSSAPPNRPPPFRAQRRADRSQLVCFNMTRHGTCRFGAQCKFSHDAQVPVRQLQHGTNMSFQQKNELCRLFQQGRCRWGDRCKYVHAEPTNSGSKQGPTSFGRQQLGRVDYQGPFEPFQQSGASSSSLG
jgi:hypothetical protein